MKNLMDWSRLASAACTTRDELRSLIPPRSRRNEPKPPLMLLVNVRQLAIRNAETLRLALKHPARPAATRSPSTA
jgi:hypothetical protein